MSISPMVTRDGSGTRGCEAQPLMQTNQVSGVNSTLPPLCAAFVIASLTWSKW
jgi:hypothetical protein